VLKGATVGISIALAAWLIPIVHVVSGSIGSFAGGYIGAKALESPDALKAMGIGILMGAAIATASAAVFGIVILIFDLDTFWLLAAPAAGIWTAGLGMVGALLGSRSAGNEASF
jgi:hypothetical protein